MIQVLYRLQDEYYAQPETARKDFYLQKREVFNTYRKLDALKAGLLIFLNRTCFNGLYRVNLSGEFNVPFGRYVHPTICDETNLRAVHHALENVIILNSDFEETLSYASGTTIFYMDPPYRPLNSTSSFNTYTQGGFDDREQQRLKLFCDAISASGYNWILSNSAPEDDFFDILYADYTITTVKARRAINSKAEKRGKLTELLISSHRKERKGGRDET